MITTAMICCGSVAFVAGLLLLISPRVIVKLGEFANRIFIVDDFPIRHHVVTGIALLVLSVLLFIVGRITGE